MQTRRLAIVSLTLLTLILAGCIQPNDPNKHTKQKAGIGAAVGAVAGAIIGPGSVIAGCIESLVEKLEKAG